MNYTEEVIKALLVASSVATGAWLFKVIKCMVSTLKKVDAALPILLKVADEMKPNGGTTLRDKVDKIVKQLVFQEGARRILVDLFDDGAFYECDSRGQYLYVNRAWTNITSLSLTESLGEGWLTGVHPDDRDFVFTEWTQCVEQNREFNLEFNMVDHDGHITRVDAHARPVRDYTGNVIGFVGLNRAI